VRRTIDQSLQHAFDLGVTDALHARPLMATGGVSRAGCCGACLALIDGATIQTTRPFPPATPTAAASWNRSSPCQHRRIRTPTGQERWDR